MPCVTHVSPIRLSINLFGRGELIYQICSEIRDKMKSLVLLASGAILVAAVATGCGDAKKKSVGDVEVTSFPVREVILSADKNFRIVLDGDTSYLDQYASIHWPEAFGESDIAPLRDSLMRYCFGDSVFSSPEDAIRHFVNDTTVFGESNGTVRLMPVDSLPAPSDGVRCYFNNVTASVVEYDESMVTYQVTTSVYLGGAHPMTTVHPFTYDLAEGRVLDVGNMFTAQGRDSIMPVIINALARQLDVPVSGLDRAGIFSSQLTYPGQPYINNNVLYFHYNPYDIAPYSSGMIDVAVYPYEVERFLAPGVINLFDVGI